MIMDNKCPYCGSEAINFGSPDEDWWGEELVSRWDARCENGHEFIVSEVRSLTSRIVAKDEDDLERLITEEEKECE